LLFKQVAEREFGLGGFASAVKHLHRQQRIAAQLKKAIFHSHLVDT
jgi:hypothetical protein